MSGIEVIRCEIAPKALYFPSKLHKIIISKAYNSAPNLPILTYDVFFRKDTHRLIFEHFVELRCERNES